MLISNLMSLGRPLLKGGMSPRELLELISDIKKPNVKSFFSNILVIEIDMRKEFRCMALEPIQWGKYVYPSQKNKKQIFQPDLSNAAALPFVWSSGGNPVKPQGAYGVPVYLTFEKSWKDELQKGVDGTKKFLEGRIDRTIDMQLSTEQLKIVAEKLHEASFKVHSRGKEKLLGLIVLASLREDGPFILSDHKPLPGDRKLALIGPSKLHQGKFIVADLYKMLECFWQAKIREGAEKGTMKDSSCYFCGKKMDLVSAYCKSWSWFTTTWGCPLPMELKERELVKSIAMCPECYKAFTCGACAFDRLTRPLDIFLVKEIFSPVASAGGKESVRQGNSVEEIQGCAYVVPLMDKTLDDAGLSDDFAESVLMMMEGETPGDKLSTHIKKVTGFESSLPDDFDRQGFLINLVYYSGDLSRGDIHLRAMIEDILPSTLTRLDRLTGTMMEYAESTANSLFGKLSDKYASFVRNRYSSIPWLLVNAYGGPYIWDSLRKVLYQRSLSRKRFIGNVVRRMSDLAVKLPDSLWRLQEEVLFYLVFSRFLNEYDREISGCGGDVTVRDWKELSKLVSGDDPGEMNFTDCEELGFAAGWAVKNFSSQYWHESNKKDFIKHRVMTFGSRLKPEVIWKRALVPMNEYALQRNIYMTSNAKDLLALVLLEYGRLKDDIRGNEDNFMAAFWAGYTLNRKNSEGGKN